jgi:hypothetical protein
MSYPSWFRLPTLKPTWILLAAAVALMALPAFAGSQARIVRLSDVHGTVQIDKNNGMGFENAFLNLPITQGVQVRTRDNGRAEIEFEDGSAMRLAPNTTVEFSRLNLDDSGNRISQVNLVTGMAYVNWLGKDGITLNFSRESVVVDHAAHFRLDTSSERAHLAVFKGEVAIDGSAGKSTVAKNKTVTFDVAQDDKSAVAGNIAAQPLDSWDRDANAYHDQYAKNNVSSPYGYGLSDLNYYGAYSNVPGYGMMWQPFFTGVGWDPFADGAWGWYPGMGYMFASAYPWGWLPYRYGNWAFIPGNGWMWQPGGWNTWVPVPSYTATTLTHVNAPVVPATGTTKTIVVGRGAEISGAPTSRFTVNPASASLGILRGSLDNLSHLNRQVAKNGFAEVPRTAQFSATSPERESAFGAPDSLTPLSSMSDAHSSSSTVGHSSGGGSSGGAHH